MKKITQQELKSILAEHKLWLESNKKKGKRADLCGTDLRGANLESAFLYEADLKKANLRDADLRGADLRRANLIDADLREANLIDADLKGTFISKNIKILGNVKILKVKEYHNFDVVLEYRLATKLEMLIHR